MAIKIGGTTVIDNSRVAQNITDVSAISYQYFKPVLNIVTSAGTAFAIDLSNAYTSIVMNSNATVSATNILGGRTISVRLANFSTYIPTFSSSFQFSPAEPTWTDHDYWRLEMICVNGTDVRVFAHGYDA